MRRHVLALLLLLVAVAPCGRAATGHEVSSIEYGPSLSGSQTLIASNGSNFVAIWTSTTFPARVLGSILDRDGRLVTPHPKLIPIGSTGYPVQLLNAGENYALLWRESSTAHVTLLTPDLTVIRTFSLPNVASARLAWNGDRLLYAFNDSTAGALLLDLDGHIVQSFFFSTDRLPNTFVQDVDADGDGFAVLLLGQAGVRVERIAGSGEVKPAVKVVPPSRGRQPGSASLAAKDGEIFVAWTLAAPVEPPVVLRAAIIHRDDSVSVPQEIAFHGTAAQVISAEPFGDGFALVAHTGTWQAALSQVSAWQIQSTGNGFTAVPFFEIPLDPARPIMNIATNGTTILGTGFPFAFHLHPAGAAPEVLSMTPRQQLAPALTSNGLDFVAAWSESALDTNLVALTRLGVDGAPLRPVPDTFLPAQFPSRPVVAFGASVYLAVWTEASDLRGALVLPTGAVMQTFVLRRGVWGTQAALAWDSRRFLVVWPEQGGIFGAFVTQDGKTTEPQQWAVAIPDEEGAVRYFVQPALAWNGRRYLLGWSSVYGGYICTCAGPPPIPYVRQISADGVPIGNVLRLAGNPERVHLASDGLDFAAVAEDYSTGVTIAPIRAVGNQLAAGQATNVFRWFNQVAANVAFDGRDYVVALRYGSSPLLGTAWLSTARVHGSAITDRRFTALDPSESPEPAIAANGSSNVLLAVSAIRPEIGAPRVYTFRESELEEMPPPPPSPTNVVATPRSSCPISWAYACGTTVVSWSGSDAAGGYLIEARGSGYDFYPVMQAPAGSTSATIDWLAKSVRVRAFGAGGVSEPSETATVAEPPRRQATRRQ